MLALGILSLVAGICAGILRLGWSSGGLHLSLALLHGPLMVCSFLGTLISLERAVALGRWWAFSAPIFTGTGGLLLILGIGAGLGPLLITLGSIMMVAIFAAVLRIQFQPFVVVMAAGAASWTIGNVVWLFGAPIVHLVMWWLGFLVLTIAGERLELSRMLFHGEHVHRAFLIVAALLFGAIGLIGAAPDAGVRAVGILLVVLAGWLLRYDVARHTVRQQALTRFIAICLLAGYFWLIVGGGIMIFHGQVVGGPIYDAMLHAVFVGFVFSMIFGHAPIIFPSVLGVPVFYRSIFYLHLAMLHASLTARIVGDLAGWEALRRWGAIFNGAAILIFLASTIYSVISVVRSERSEIALSGAPRA